ncbi:MAG TPA: DUF4349 domain-containing protein [Polyangiaceae bacterium]|jgi:hypothetical protein|nr:DUF4349 domain-containing protein [Polyangiaceae bacterium]
MQTIFQGGVSQRKAARLSRMTQRNSTSKRVSLLSLASILPLMLALGGCARHAEEAPYVSAAQPAAEAPVDPARAAMQVGDGAASPTADAQSAERKVINREELTLSSRDVQGVADRAVEIVRAAHGYVASRDDQHTDDQVVQSSLSVRVPKDAFDDVVFKLKSDVQVIDEHKKGQDVTEEFTDVAARLKAQSTLEERLLALTASRDAVKDLLEVERELARVRTEIERLTGRKQWLENQVAFATIDLQIWSPDQPRVGGTESIGSRFASAFSDGMEIAVEVTTGLIRMAFAFAPVTPIGLAVYFCYVAIRRRRNQRLQA